MITTQDILGDDFEHMAEFNAVAKIDFKLFCKRMLNLDLQEYHMDWFYTIRNNPRVSILAPTGFGKTAILGAAYSIWMAYFYQNKEILIISNTLPQSTRVLSEIKKHIEDNEILQMLKPKNHLETWSKQTIKTSSQCVIKCRPYSENIKGEHVDHILLDEASSYRELQIYFDYIVPRVNSKGGRIVLISTPESPTDLMGVIRARKLDYVCKSYPAVNKKGESIWPERFPLEKLEKIKAELGEQYFEKNYMCNPTAETEDAIYPLSSIMNCYDYTEKFTMAPEEEEQTFMACDFAVSSGPTADFDAYVIIGKVRKLHYIRHIEIHKGLPVNAKVERIKELFEAYTPLRVIVDESNVGSAIIDDLRFAGLPVVPQSFQYKARNKLLMTMKNIIDGKKLVIPRSKDDHNALRLTDTLTKQLLGFKETKSPNTQMTQYLSTAAHDDIAVSLAMALSESSRQKDFEGSLFASG